jgi:hypothetical protein
LVCATAPFVSRFYFFGDGAPRFWLEQVKPCTKRKKIDCKVHIGMKTAACEAKGQVGNHRANYCRFDEADWVFVGNLV